VAARLAKQIGHAAVGKERHALEAERRPCTVAAQLLEPFSLPARKAPAPSRPLTTLKPDTSAAHGLLVAARVLGRPLVEKAAPPEPAGHALLDALGDGGDLLA